MNIVAFKYFSTLRNNKKILLFDYGLQVIKVPGTDSIYGQIVYINYHLSTTDISLYYPCVAAHP